MDAAGVMPLAVFANRQVTGTHTWRAGRASQKAKGKGQKSKCPEAESAANETVPGAGQAGLHIVSPFPPSSGRPTASDYSPQCSHVVRFTTESVKHPVAVRTNGREVLQCRSRSFAQLAKRH